MLPSGTAGWRIPSPVGLTHRGKTFPFDQNGLPQKIIAQALAFKAYAQTTMAQRAR
jgi:hypothetical protein